MAFIERLHELGFAEERNLVIELRTSAGHTARLPERAADLARQPCDVFFAPGTEAHLVALKQATQGRDMPPRLPEHDLWGEILDIALCSLAFMRPMAPKLIIPHKLGMMVIHLLALGAAHDRGISYAALARKAAFRPIVRFRVKSHWTSSSYTVAATASIPEGYLVEEVSILIKTNP